MQGLTIDTKTADRMAKWLPRLVAFLALAAFILSFSALQDTAVKNGVNWILSPLIPLVIDGVIITASLAVLIRSLTGDSTWYAWLLVVIFSGVSVAFNVIHANDTATAQLLAAVPPVVLLLSFELWMSLLKSGIQRSGAIMSLSDIKQKTIAANQQLVSVTREAEKMTSQRDRLAAECQELEDLIVSKWQKLSDDSPPPVTDPPPDDNDTAPADVIKWQDVKERRDIVCQLAQDGKTQEEIAALVDVSERTVYRDLKQLNGKVKS